MELTHSTILAALLLALTCLSPAAALAQKFPDRPVRLIVPFPPGGSVDFIARAIGPRLAQELGQPVVIENKGGASGTIGTAEVARAKPDGYTLLLVFDSHAANAHLYKGLKYDTFESFEYVSLLVTAPMLVMASNKVAASTLPDFIAHAKAHPKTVTYGSSGVGTSNHLYPMLLSDRAQIDTIHVPYKGGGPMLADLLGGQIVFVIATLPTVVQQVKAGQTKALAIASTARVPQLPNVPTVGETLPGFEAWSWIGMLAPAGTPQPIVSALNREFNQIVNLPDVHKLLTTDGSETAPISPAEFGVLLANGINKLDRVIKQTGIKLE